MDQKQKVINYYDATHIDYRMLWTGATDLAVHFGYYDEKTSNHHSAVVRMNEILADTVKVRKEDTVLDAGCGYGGSAMWLADHFGCEVVGITLSPLQAAKAQKYILKRHLGDKVKVLEGDFSALPVSNASFDVYWALESLVHAENRDSVLKEAYRILKPGGRIIIAEYTLREDPPVTSSETEYLKPWLQGWAMPSLSTPAQFRTQLTEVGFTGIEIQNITTYVQPSLRRLKFLCILHYPIMALLGPLFFRVERLHNYYASWRQIQSLEKGLWDYSLITATKV